MFFGVYVYVPAYVARRIVRIILLIALRRFGFSPSGSRNLQLRLFGDSARAALSALSRHAAFAGAVARGRRSSGPSKRAARGARRDFLTRIFYGLYMRTAFPGLISRALYASLKITT